MEELTQNKISNALTVIDKTSYSKTQTNRKNNLTFDRSGIDKELDQWDELYQSMKKISKCKSHREVITTLPSLIETLIDFDKFSMIIADEKLEEFVGFQETNKNPNEYGFIVGRMFKNGKWIKILSVPKYEYSAPQFVSLMQLAVGRKR